MNIITVLIHYVLVRFFILRKPVIKSRNKLQIFQTGYCLYFYYSGSRGTYRACREQIGSRYWEKLVQFLTIIE